MDVMGFTPFERKNGEPNMEINPDSTNYVPVYETSGKLAGESVRLMLEAKGIPAFVSQESAGIALGLTIGKLGIAKVYVAADREDEARQILQEMEAGRVEPVPFTDEEDDGEKPIF